MTTFVQNLDECDIAVLVFDPTNPMTLEWLRIQQSKLPGHIPCRYVALERESTNDSAVSTASTKAQKASTYAAGKEWCISLELEPPTKLSAVPKQNRLNAIQNFFEQVMVSGLAPTSCRPVSPERTWEDQKRRAWLYSSIAFGAAVAIGVAVMLRKTLLSRNSTSTEDTRDN
jgi:hypothetical protein